jgi:hypothetical protein
MQRFTKLAGLVCVGAVVSAAAAEAGVDSNGRVSGPWASWTNGAAIPDNSTTGVTIDLPIAGAIYPIADVTISIVLTHTWIGDVEAVLESPNGTAKLRLFDRPG